MNNNKLPPPPLSTDSLLASQHRPRARTNSITQILNSIPILNAVQSFEESFEHSFQDHTTQATNTPDHVHDLNVKYGHSNLHSNLHSNHGHSNNNNNPLPPTPLHHHPDAGAGCTPPPTPPHRHISRLDLGISHRSSKSSSSSSSPHHFSPSSPLKGPLKGSTSVSSRSNNLTVLKLNLTPYPRQTQYLLLASLVFTSTLLYGFLQELCIVRIFGKKLPLFLSYVQFQAYAIWSIIVFINHKRSTTSESYVSIVSNFVNNVPWSSFFKIAVLRTVDLGLTNGSMKYVNYPTKTLMKSSRVIFTMGFGKISMGKKHKRR